ncbi:unnamed protein product [Spirodela intermedia]|uniref:Uncharacterized protein n=1 Tax=Spirodela intermedia TaxID=51605 RepID=A0A7I8K4N0_SPIIN|nr:unnamed protein product [Spirodela intermedia]
MVCSSSLPWRHLQHDIGGPARPFSPFLVVIVSAIIMGLLPWHNKKRRNRRHPYVINCSLGNLLRSLVGKNLTTWHLIIPHRALLFLLLGELIGSLLKRDPISLFCSLCGL